MKKAINVISIILSLVVVLSVVTTNFAYAIDPNTYDPGENGEIDANAIGTHVGPIFNVLYGISILITVISLSIIGLKMIVGSAQEKAEFKKNLFPVVLGICIISSIFSIISTLAKFADLF